jgi:hypothetical protein
MAGKLVRDYYQVSVPGNCAESLEELGDIAIQEARERAKLYVVPCNWEAQHVAGELGDFEVKFKVCRTRHKATSKTKAVTHSQ